MEQNASSQGVENAKATQNTASPETAMSQAASNSSQGNGTGGMTYKVKFTSFPENSSIKGICSVTMNDAFCVKGVKVIEGSKGLFMALPSYKSGEEYKDVCHPVTAEGRKSMSEAVLNAYAVQSEEHAQNIGAAGIGQNGQMAAPEGVPMEQLAGMNQGGIGQQ